MPGSHSCNFNKRTSRPLNRINSSHNKWAGPSHSQAVIAHLFEEFIMNSFRINLGLSALNVFEPALEHAFLGMLTLGAYWLILLWMFRNKIFIRI